MHQYIIGNQIENHVRLLKDKLMLKIDIFAGPPPGPIGMYQIVLDSLGRLEKVGL